MDKPRLMNHVFAFLLAGIVFQFSNAWATPVNVIDSSYHVWGDIRYENFTGTPTYQDSYDYTDDVPVSAQRNYSYNDGFTTHTVFAESRNHEFGLCVTAIAESNMSAINVANAYAEADWSFQPVYDIGQLTISYSSPWSGYTAFGVLLEDNGGTVLGNYSGGLTVPLDINMPESYPYYSTSTILDNYWDGNIIFNNLTSDNEYHLYLWSWANANEDDELMTIEATNLQSVPEPGNMILLGSGLVLIAGLGREFRKRQNRNKK